MKKILVALVAVVILLFGLLGLQMIIRGPVEPAAASQTILEPSAFASPAPSPTPEPAPVITTLRFSATGDNLIHNGIYNQAAKRAQVLGQEGYDFSFCYDQVRDFYKQFDINWINQETLVNDELDPSTYPCFSTPGDLGRDAYDAGFRVFSLSNNHTYDKGAAGLDATQRFWETMPEDTITCGLYTKGSEQDGLVFQEVEGVKIAYLSFTEFTNGIKTPEASSTRIIYTSETELIQSMVTAARQQADFVVVGVHWGIEGSHRVTDGQKNLAQSLADWGADVVIGTHPHVVQDAAWLTAADGRTAFVAYSLGNFLNAQSTPDTMIGAVLDFTIQKTTQPDGASKTEVLSPVLHPVINHYGQNYSQIRLYMLSDYTNELAQTHGVRAEHPEFGLSYIESVLKNSIQSEFLQLT